MFRPLRPIMLATLLTSAPWLFGADAGGCGATRTPYPTNPDSGADACVAQQGEACGGNVRNPCQCASGLECKPDSASHNPVGDVGGSCQKSSSPAAGSGGAAPNPSDAGTTSPTDAGKCVAKRGEHCGGNTSNPCTCDKGLQCRPVPGSTLPPGDVGGTCEPPPKDDQDGGVCLSDRGGPCGGNTAASCICANDLVCKAKPGSNLPVGDVGGTCEEATKPQTCQHAEDCEIQANYCSGCDCDALVKGEMIAPCTGPGVRCLVDPCGNKKADCVNGLCVAR